MQYKISKLFFHDEQKKRSTTSFLIALLFHSNIHCRSKINDWLQTTDQCLELPPCNSYLMRILYQEIPKKYPNLTLSQVSVEGQKFWKSMKIERLSKKEREEKEKLAEDEKQNKMNQMAGFRRVIDFMQKSKKPLLGHNMFLDLCYFYNYFLAPLPEDVQEFKETLLKSFPM